jgi:hypothetical protein
MSGQERERADRAGQGAAGAAELLVQRHGRHRPPGHGDAQADSRCAHRTHPLQGSSPLGRSAVFAPARTPPAIVSKLSDDIRSVLDLSDVKQGIATLGAEATGSSPKGLEEWVRGQIERWRRVLANADIKRD